MNKSIANLIDEITIRVSSTPSNFRMGKELLDTNKVEIIEYTPEKVTAKVNSSVKRKVEFILNKDFMNWKCTCRLNQKKFCKHSVAVGLEIIKRKL